MRSNLAFFLAKRPTPFKGKRGHLTKFFVMTVSQHKTLQLTIISEFHDHFLRNETQFSVFLAKRPTPFKGKKGHLSKFFVMTVLQHKTLQLTIISEFHNHFLRNETQFSVFWQNTPPLLTLFTPGSC